MMDENGQGAGSIREEVRVELEETRQDHDIVIKFLDDIAEDEWRLTGNYPDINDNLIGGQRSLEEMFHYLTAHFREHEEDVRGAIEER